MPMPAVNNVAVDAREAVEELIETERTYVNRLSVVYEVPYIYKHINSKVYKMHADDLLSEHDKRTLFGNIEEILHANQLFLTAITTSGDNVADTIIDFMTIHFVPYAEYCCNHKRACEFLRERERVDDRFRQFMADGLLAVESHGLDLASFLLEPVQRIARYPLLIKNIINYTDDKQERAQLQAALQAAQQLLDTVNAAVGEHENEERLRELDFLLQWHDYKVNLTEACKWGGKRELLVTDITGTDSLNRPVKAYLFTDFLLVTDGAVEYKVVQSPWPIEQVEFDGVALVRGMERVFITSDDEMVAVEIRAALDKAQQSFFSGLDRLHSSFTGGDCDNCGVLSVIISGLSDLYQLPSKFTRQPTPFARLSIIDQNKKTFHQQDNITLDTLTELPVRTPADHLLLQVFDDRPFGPAISMGRYSMPVGDLADYFVGVWSDLEVRLEGVPRGKIQFRVKYNIK